MHHFQSHKQRRPAAAAGCATGARMHRDSASRCVRRAKPNAAKNAVAPLVVKGGQDEGDHTDVREDNVAGWRACGSVLTGCGTARRRRHMACGHAVAAPPSPRRSVPPPQRLFSRPGDQCRAITARPRDARKFRDWAWVSHHLNGVGLEHDQEETSVSSAVDERDEIMKCGQIH